MRRIVVSLLSWNLIFASSDFAGAADWDPVKLEAVVTNSAEIYVKAFQGRNAAGLAALFTESAEYVDSDGGVYHGREAIQATYASYFEGSPDGELSIELTSVRPIAATALVEEGISTFRPKGDGPVTSTRYAATHVLQENGEWLIAHIRELSPTEMTNHERLKELAWLIGHWRDESPDSVVNSEWKWSDDGNFLLAEFTMKSTSGTGKTGSHRIGWDAQRKQFRSWIFDAEGGFAEGTWADQGGVWEVTLSATLSTGQSGTGLLRYERDGNDAMIVSQLRRVVAGTALPDSETRAVRSPPEPSP